jgi:hypothetical protein
MVGGIIFFVVVVGGIASAFLLFYRKAVKDSRRIGAQLGRCQLGRHGLGEAHDAGVGGSV